MSGGKRGSRRPYQRCCARRATYLNNKRCQQFGAHGRYLACECSNGLQWNTIAPNVHKIMLWFVASERREAHLVA